MQTVALCFSREALYVASGVPSGRGSFGSGTRKRGKKKGPTARPRAGVGPPPPYPTQMGSGWGWVRPIITTAASEKCGVGAPNTRLIPAPLPCGSGQPRWADLWCNQHGVRRSSALGGGRGSDRRAPRRVHKSEYLTGASPVPHQYLTGTSPAPRRDALLQQRRS